MYEIMTYGFVRAILSLLFIKCSTVFTKLEPLERYCILGFLCQKHEYKRDIMVVDLEPMGNVLTEPQARD